MAGKVAVGIQSFDTLIEKQYFYIDKTSFIREWWGCGDAVTLIVRPRRFGKTLNMSMTEQFFSIEYKNRADLFQKFAVWKDPEYRKLQGTYPVISLSFANVKERDYLSTKTRICQLITDLYQKYYYVRAGADMTEADREFFDAVRVDMPETVATIALYKLCDFLYRYYGKKVIILLDEYDTPMQEAWICGFWEELTAFCRSMFNAAFKTNPWLERGLMTGITRISKESIFSDLNNLKIITTTSDEYADSFGFTEKEVFAALEECGLEREKEAVKWWYDGFTFGTHKDIYNPWSILNFLDTGKYAPYWANTSSNSLVGKLIQEGNTQLKESFENLLRGESIYSVIDEQIVYTQLNGNERAVWSLLLASGYLKIVSVQNAREIPYGAQPKYELALTNLEVKMMFENMVRDWFAPAEADYNKFVAALLNGELDAMNGYMNRVALQVFSYFDTGAGTAMEEPERFYHGFVLGMIVELQNRYIITSNRESGFGRYDVMLEPRSVSDPAFILEFKVKNSAKESALSDTVQSALMQIEEKQYDAVLLQRGIPKERIHCYGFAFQGRNVLIGTNEN